MNKQKRLQKIKKGKQIKKKNEKRMRLQKEQEIRHKK